MKVQKTRGTAEGTSKPAVRRRFQIPLTDHKTHSTASVTVFWPTSGRTGRTVMGVGGVGILDLKREDIYRCSRILAQLKVTFQGTLPSQKQNKTKPIRSQGRTSVELDST